MRPPNSPRFIIVALALVSAAVHFWLLLGFPDVPFLLNGLGYLTFAGLYLTQPAPVLAHARLFHGAFIGYTLVTILAWAAIGERTLLAYADKLVELVLVGLLASALRQLKPDSAHQV